jgi:hypothetical protein
MSKNIRTLNPLNLLLFTFQIFISISQEKFIKHAQKNSKDGISNSMWSS